MPDAPSEFWSVPLPTGAEPPFGVFINGVQKAEGADYTVEGRWLRFREPLKPKVQIGFRRRVALLAGIGVYKDLKADSVDLQYHVAGRVRSQSGLPIIPPQTPLGDESH